VYLLDTNIISELRRAKPHGAVLAWLSVVPDSALHVPALCLGEIQRGIELTRERDPATARSIEQWADGIMTSYHLLPMDAETFRIWARLMHCRSDSLYEDAMIAATAIQHRLIVVTRNLMDFAHFDVQRFDPFTYRP